MREDFECPCSFIGLIRFRLAVNASFRFQRSICIRRLLRLQEGIMPHFSNIGARWDQWKILRIAHADWRLFDVEEDLAEINDFAL